MRALLTVCLLACGGWAWAQGTEAVPESLKPWEGWVLEGKREQLAPKPYDDAAKPLAFWPSRLALRADAAGARFAMEVAVFAEAWVPLPGGREAWPVEVLAGGKPVPAVERNGFACVRLPAGNATIEGRFAWPEMPARIALPPSIGLISVELDGQEVTHPAWDASGFLWLKREPASGETERDFLATQLYGVVEDGIPLWLRIDVELAVSGKSREEDIGVVLPSGWSLASVESQIPAAVDEGGRLRAQVRAGKWVVSLLAFRLDDARELAFGEGAAVGEMLLALQARPTFRVVEFEGAEQVDVSQTTFPQKWRQFPVFRWELDAPLGLVERMRGMGDGALPGLAIARQWWLDSDGRGLTFRDQISGNQQRIWRLDAAAGQELGSVRSGGVGQLITRNPADGAAGFEVRSRMLDVSATGRMANAATLPASGWRTTADSLSVTLNLPPGWRMLAASGPDSVRGDWVTGWSLLDLFLVLIFGLAVFRLWGIGPAALAFAAFALSYHEPGAPRFAWLALLIPLALLRVVREGWGLRIVQTLKWVIAAWLILALAPFVASQVQQALYPQLEKLPGATPQALVFSGVSDPSAFRMEAGELLKTPSSGAYREERRAAQREMTSNLAQDKTARIQTGPGVPEWSWRTVSLGWNGPVSETQTVRMFLISSGVERLLSVLRVVLLLALALFLLRGKKPPAAIAPTALGLLLFLAPATGARAEFPPPELLEELRARLLEAPDAFPRAAEIPFASLRIADGLVTVNATVAVAARCAVPVPGKFAGWSPLAVTVDGRPAAALRRQDGFLWVVLDEGVREVRVDGRLADVDEWEWAFQLRPRMVAVDAPGWSVSGVRSDGIPEQQVFLAREERSATAAETRFDRQDLQALAVVEREIELGLRWQVRTTVRRLSPPGRSIALKVPLLEGENVLSARAVVSGSAVEVRLGAQEASFSWESELAETDKLRLNTRTGDTWVERWSLLVSPVWNVALAGLPPTFEASAADLVPVWNPWPGESVEIGISRPEAIPGPTVTVRSATHEVSLGTRQRTELLRLSLESSLGEDFPIVLPKDVEVTSLDRDGQALPVRVSEGRLVVPMVPGGQQVSVGWRASMPLEARARAGRVELPVESANIETILRVPESRWVLWTDGPTRGPAVRFWTILACALLAAWALSRVSFSPLPAGAWMILALGLTQVPLPAALIVVVWFLLLALRGRDAFQTVPPWVYNVCQIGLVGLTFVVAAVFIQVVGAGLLGNPEMFIAGNGSTPRELRWYMARSGPSLPEPGILSVSIWWYRFLMLAWALWLAVSMLGWVRWAWGQFSAGGCLRGPRPPVLKPPPLPKAN